MTTRIIREAKAIYSALQDKEALRRGPVFIEKDGQTEAVLLSIDRYRELVGESELDQWVKDQLAPLQPEIETFQKMLPELLKKHRGEWVAIHNGKVLEISPEHAEMSHRLTQQGLYPLLIRRIQEKPRILEAPSPEFVSRV